jgi:hypothetical protein
MQHLSTETLARLVDESPAHLERVHLETCAACRCELQALQEQTAALAELPLLDAPSRGWPLLKARLAHEGLLHHAPASAEHPRWNRPHLLRAAAYVGLFLLGGAGGLAVGRAGSGDGWAADQPAALPQTSEVAARHLQEAELAYLAALAHYQELSGVTRGTDPAARLAALEGIVLTTRAALEAAPADPVINGYYLTAIGQRDAVLRQIAQTTEDPWF